MASGNREKHSAHPIRKKFLRWGMIGILSLLFLEFVVYFGSNIFLSKFAQRKINEASGNVYSIDFNRFSFSLLRRGFFMDGIVMKPINPGVRKEDQALFDITLDQIAFRGLWYDFFDKQFTIGKIYIDNPNLKMDLPTGKKPVDTKKQAAHKSDKERVRPIKALEDEIKKTVQGLNLTGLIIKEVEIDHANFFFFNFLSQNALKADNTSLIVRNIDFTTGEAWKTPFNAEGFEFELERAIFPLPDGIHTIHADRVYISSLDNLIDIKNFNLIPDKTKESKAYYNVGLKEFRVGNVDLNKAFMTSVLEIDELILDYPDLNVASNPKVKSDSAASGNLNDFLKGNLKSIEIKELAINNAKFVKSQLSDTLKNRIELDELNFKMVEFYLGDDSLKKVNQFFYGQDAAMDIRGSRVYLGDQIHLLEGKEVSVSSFKDELVVRGLSIRPRPEALVFNFPEKLIKLDLAEFELADADLNLLYNEGILHADELIIYKPQVEFTEYLKSTAKKSNSVPLGEVVGGLLNEVAIRNFEVQDGMVQFKDERGQRSNNLGFEKFSFRLEEILFRPAQSAVLQEQFELGEIYLALDNYQLKLKDNLHQIMAGKLVVDSKNQLLEVQNLTIKPENQDQIQSSLKAYGKSSALDFSIPDFRAEGIDIKAAFFEERLFIRQISLPTPVFSISSFREKAKTEGSESPGSPGDIKNVLLGYFNSIVIDSIHLDNAQIKYQSQIEKKRTSFVEDDFSLKLRNFVLDKEALDQDDKTLFSDEIDLVFNNYSFNLAGGKYEVNTDRLRYNSLSKTIIIDDLELVPNEDFPGRINLGLRFPEVDLIGVDIEEFLFENKLVLDKFEFDQGVIEVGIDKKIAAKPKESGKKQVRKKSLDELVIDTILTKNSKVAINYQVNDATLKSIETDFDLMVRDFRLDSLIAATKDVGALYAEVDLNLKDFMFALPDSVHTLQFAKVAVGNLKDQIVFTDFSLTPKDHFGTPGNPAIDAKIDQLILKNNKLANIQETGQLNLREIKMINPKINVYLDTAKVEKQAKPVKEKSATSLVKDILIGDFLIENGAVTMHRKGQGPIPRLDFKGIGFDVRDLGLNLLDQSQQLDLEDLASKKLQFGVKDYSLTTPDSLYKVTIGSLDFKDNNLTLEDIYYRPLAGNYALLRKLPFQAGAMNARVGKVTLTNLDPTAYFEKNLIKADELIIESPLLDVFRDKRIPADTSVRKPMPQFLMENAKIDMDLNSLKVRDGRVRNYEFAPRGIVPGMIGFEHMKVDMEPFFLRRQGGTNPTDTVNLAVETYIMGVSKVNLNAAMTFQEKYPMDVTVRMDTFAFADANDFLSKSLFVAAVDGTVTNGNWNFTLDDEVAIGDMRFGYTDLKIQFLDSLTLERGLGKLKIFTFGANLLAKNSNPRGPSSKIVSRPIYQERDKRKFVFSAWWKASFSGLRGTFGLGKAKMPKKREEELEY